MINYRARFDDLCVILREQYNVNDRQAAAILIAARMDVGVAGQDDEPTVKYPWVILETDYTGERFEHQWFGLGLNVTMPRTIDALWWIRSLKVIPYKTDYYVQLKFDRALPHLWIEPEWKRSQGQDIHYKLRVITYQLERACIRLRTPMPKTYLVPETWRLRLGQAYRTLTDSQFRPPIARSWSLWKDVYFYMEIGSKLRPTALSWDDYCLNMQAMAIRLAWLRGKTAPDDEEKADIMRLARDYVPAWQKDALEYLRTPRSLKEVGSHLEIGIGARWTAGKELRRLRSEGIVAYRGGWVVNDPAVLAFVRGEDNAATA